MINFDFVSSNELERAIELEKQGNASSFSMCSMDAFYHDHDQGTRPMRLVIFNASGLFDWIYLNCSSFQIVWSRLVIDSSKYRLYFWEHILLRHRTADNS